VDRREIDPVVELREPIVDVRVDQARQQRAALQIDHLRRRTAPRHHRIDAPTSMMRPARTASAPACGAASFMVRIGPPRKMRLAGSSSAAGLLQGGKRTRRRGGGGRGGEASNAAEKVATGKACREIVVHGRCLRQQSRIDPPGDDISIGAIPSSRNGFQ
jgi:hypothetical protein